MNNLIVTALNKILSLDPESFDRLKQLENKILKLNLQPIDVSFNLKLSSAGFEACEGGDADISISGKPSSFIKLSQQSNPSLYNSGIKIVGDMGLGEEIKNILSQLDLDWEGLVAEYTGDVPARQISRASRAGFRWAKQTNNNVQQDVKEYLQEELRILPTRVEMEEFTAENRQLRDVVARLAAKIA